MTVRALIVDDSALIRKLLSDILSEDPNIMVIGTAVNGKDGLEKIEKLRPDVVLLDNVMPVLDGLKTLARIMKEYPYSCCDGFSPWGESRRDYAYSL